MSRPPRIRGGVPGANIAKQQRRTSDEASTFIDGAPSKDTLPWHHPTVRDDLMVQMNAAQPERVMLALEWVIAQEGKSKRQFVEEAIREKLERSLAKRGLTF